VLLHYFPPTCHYKNWTIAVVRASEMRTLLSFNAQPRCVKKRLLLGLSYNVSEQAELPTCVRTEKYSYVNYTATWTSLQILYKIFGALISRAAVTSWLRKPSKHGSSLKSDMQSLFVSWTVPKEKRVTVLPRRGELMIEIYFSANTTTTRITPH